MQQTNELSRNRSILMILAVLSVFSVSGFLLYSKTFESPFIFDDILRIEENQSIRVTELSAENLIEAAFGKQSAKTRASWQCYVCFKLLLHQYNVEGYHLVNIVIHILAGIFLFIFIQTTLNLPSLKTEVDHTFHGCLFCGFALVGSSDPNPIGYLYCAANEQYGSPVLYSCFLALCERTPCGATGQKMGLVRRRCTGMDISHWGANKTLPPCRFLFFFTSGISFQDLSVDWLKRNLKYLSCLVVFVFGVIALLYLGLDP